MCYNYNLKAAKSEIQKRYEAEFIEETEPHFDIIANGFTHLKMPVITNDKPNKIQLFHWGLIPSWVKDTIQAKEIANMCLNAKIETIEEKPSFKASAIHKRCIIPATSFYEWKWLDSKGKNKEKFEIHLTNDSLFAFGGLWSNWTNKVTGEIIETFTIVTTTANTLMAEIHNTKKRMPLLLQTNEINNWLNESVNYDNISGIAHNQNLSAISVEPKQTSFF